MHPGEVSAWHVVASAELWLYRSGSLLTLTLGGSSDAPSNAKNEELVLGPDVAAGERPQQLVPPGVWQTALNSGTELWH